MTPDDQLLELVAGAVGRSGTEWRVSPALDKRQPWIVAEPADCAFPDQGWKLHVASYASTAAETLAGVLPPIVAAGAAFKVLGSLYWLRGINRGAAGLSQVGKFITVYPVSDDLAVSLALELAQATDGLRGPRIPSDRPLTTHGVVHYRYGAFGGGLMQTRLGEVTFSLVDPEGRLVPDRRGVVPRDPPWVSDPFAARGLGAASPLTTPLADRYRPVALLAQSPGVVVQLAFDVTQPRPCIVKRTRRRGPRGRAPAPDDPGLRLRREAEILADLSEHGCTPRLYDLVDDGEEIAMVTEDLGGETLERYMGEHTRRGALPPGERIVELGVGLADALAALHERGLVHGDLKSANVVVVPDGSARLIDLDLAQRLGSSERPPGAGTRGYTSPNCREGGPVAVTDDVFALGAVLLFLMTGAEPSRAPDVDDLLARSPMLMNPRLRGSLVGVVERCLSADPDRRFASMAEVRDALLALSGDPRPGGRHHVRADEALRRARGAADHICAQAEPSDRGLEWRSTYYVGKGNVGRDVNSGMAGTILALAELVDEFGCERHVAVLGGAATRLTDFPPWPGDEPAGLYVGEAGVAAALLRAGQVLGDAELVRAAGERMCAVASRPVESPDLFHGAAGRLLVHLLLWDETGDPMQLAAAVRMGDSLLETSEGDGSWRIPEGYDELSGHRYLGYAHGAAGIADALLDLFEATGDRRYLDTAVDAMSWIAAQALPVLDDESGVGWPLVEGEAVYPPFWCHGATGIGRLFLHAWRLDAFPGAPDMVRRASRSAAHGARWSGPTLCHGLAGNAEFLLDVGQWTGERRFVDDAHELMSLAGAFAVESEEGCAWITEAPRQITPDYLVGYAGTALALLRLARPERVHQMSRAGFAYAGPARTRPVQHLTSS